MGIAIVGTKTRFIVENGLGIPDFLCIGAQKSGTSWLYRVLMEHPQIFMPPIKELHFFDRIGTDDLALRGRHHELATRGIVKEKRKWFFADKKRIAYLERIVSHDMVTPEWYREAYSWPVPEGVRRGDITPSYLELTAEQVAYARKMLGPAKLILIVRNPLDRQLSQLRMWAQRDKGSRLPQNDDEWLKLFKQMRKYERRGAYSEGIPVWQAHFGSENMLVLPYGDLRSDPRGLLAKVEDFLGIARLKKYRHLADQVHATKKLTVPASVVQRARKRTAAEDEYLKATFGQAFFEQTR
jgi:hypothetical protein